MGARGRRKEPRRWYTSAERVTQAGREDSLSVRGCPVPGVVIVSERRIGGKGAWEQAVCTEGAGPCSGAGVWLGEEDTLSGEPGKGKKGGFVAGAKPRHSPANGNARQGRGVREAALAGGGRLSGMLVLCEGKNIFTKAGRRPGNRKGLGTFFVLSLRIAQSSLRRFPLRQDVRNRP